MSGARWGVVVPSNRPESLRRLRRDWGPLLRARKAKLFAVLDEPPWEGIPACIPRRTGNIRSYGFYRAWASGVDYVLSLDDDVAPLNDIFDAYEQAFEDPAPVAAYLSVGALVGEGVEMRGFPYEARWSRVGIQYGGWHGVPDLDAVTQITRPPVTSSFAQLVLPVPRGCAATCCAMNFAFRAELAPLAWQHSTRERWGDIWSGLYQKAALDDAGLAMLVNGYAVVAHERASNPWANLNMEAAGMGPNEGLWDAVSRSPEPYAADRPDPVLAWEDATDRAAAHFAVAYDDGYANEFLKRRDAWRDLFR